MTTPAATNPPITLTTDEAASIFRDHGAWAHCIRRVTATVDELDGIVWWTAEADVGDDTEDEWVSMSFPEHWPEVEIAWGVNR